MNTCLILWIFEFLIWFPILLKWAFPNRYNNSSILRPYYTWIRNRFTFASGSTVFLGLHAVIVIAIGFCTVGRDQLPEALQPQIKNIGIRLLYGIECFVTMLQGDTESFLTSASEIRSYAVFLCVIIPILTASAVIVSVAQFLPKFWGSGKEVLIFSGTDQRSLLLAEDMERKERKHLHRSLNKKRRFIFLYTDRDELSQEQLRRLNVLKARIYPYSMEDLLTIHPRLRRSQLRFFYLGEDSADSFDKLKRLIDAVKENKLFKAPILPWRKNSMERLETKSIYHQELYVLSESDTSPLLADRLRRDMSDEKTGNRLPQFAHTDLRLLDRYRIVTYKLLQDHPLYKCPTEKNGNHVRILILGFGRVGQSFLRSATAFSAMRNREVSFTILDSKMGEHWGEFLTQAPNIEKALNFPILHNKLNLESNKLTDRLTKLTQAPNPPFNYIVLSLGDDDRNIRVARILVRHYRKTYWESKAKGITPCLPAIFVNLENSVKAEYINKIFKTGDDDPLAMLSPIAIGGDEETFAEDTLLNRKLWNAAVQLHHALKHESKADDKTPNHSHTTDTLAPFLLEYERRSSIAAVSFANYHHIVLDDAENIDAEHKRWMAYSLSEGMQNIDQEVAIAMIKSPLQKHRDVIAGLTPCLVPTDDLRKLYEELCLNYPPDKIPTHSFRSQDRLSIERVPYIRENLKKDIMEFDLSKWKDSWKHAIKALTENIK